MRLCKLVAVITLMLIAASPVKSQPPDKPAPAKPVTIKARQVQVVGWENDKLKLVADGVAMEIVVPQGKTLTPGFNLAAGHMILDSARGTMTADENVSLTFARHEELLFRVSADRVVIDLNQIAPDVNAK